MPAPRTKTQRLPEAIRRLLIDAIEADTLDLPYLPGTAREIMQLCSDEQVEARELAELVQRDQSIAIRVLRTANSSAYAPKEPIVSLQQAIGRLGITTLRDIAVGMTLKGEVFEVPGYGVALREMWMHSAATALCAKEVARRVGQNVDEAFLVGLLHDAGQPIVMQNLVRIAAAKTDKPVPTAIMEAAVAEFHAEVGSRMVGAWKLPEWMRACIRSHHDELDSGALSGESTAETALLQLADRLAHWALDDTLGAEDFAVEMQAIRDLDLGATDVADLLALRGTVLELTEAFA